MARGTQEDLVAHLEPVATRAGLVIEGVAVAAAGRRRFVRVVVDLPDGQGGVSSDALADVSREISHVLDAHDLVHGSYTLEVTTPGVDRPLTEPRHFRRALGRMVEVTTATGTRTGRLAAVDEDAITLGDVRIPLADIDRAVTQVELVREE
ncbi:MAG: ribosome maturation factor RimP [Actinomycetales bacterium]|nr:ribosome maturation factor RimP [Actinomycetales bacterium]